MTHHTEVYAARIGMQAILFRSPKDPQRLIQILVVFDRKADTLGLRIPPDRLEVFLVGISPVNEPVLNFGQRSKFLLIYESA